MYSRLRRLVCSICWPASRNCLRRFPNLPRRICGWPPFCLKHALHVYSERFVRRISSNRHPTFRWCLPTGFHLGARAGLGWFRRPTKRDLGKWCRDLELRRLTLRNLSEPQCREGILRGIPPIFVAIQGRAHVRSVALVTCDTTLAYFRDILYRMCRGGVRCRVSSALPHVGDPA